MGASADFFDMAGIGAAVRALRSGREGLGKAAEHWPELRRALRDTSKDLRARQEQMKLVLAQRPALEAAQEQSRTLLEGLAAGLPMYTEQWGVDLADQERSLSNLYKNLDEVTAVMPEAKVTGARLMMMTRLLLSLAGAIFLLHGGYLAITSWVNQAAVAPALPSLMNGAATIPAAPPVDGLARAPTDAVAQ
jgi:hypothetical protein